MLSYEAASRQNFDRQADVYDTTNYGQHARKLYPVLLSQLAELPKAHILDVGCGTGALLEKILRRWPESHCTGLDLSPNMVTVAREKLGSCAQILCADAVQLPLADASFDVVLCNDSFHHYSYPQTVLQEIHRVLKPGGVFLLGDTTAPALLRGAINLLLPFGHGGDVHLYSSQEAERLLAVSFSGAESRRISATSFLAWGVR